MKDFRDEFYKFATLIENKTPMALVRYGDGEHLLMEGKGVSNITQAYKVDGWGAEPRLYKMSYDLLDSLQHTEPNYYYAIPCQCCNEYGKKFYLDRIKQGMDNITYANVFINGNYPLWKNFLYSMGQHIVLIANEAGIGKDLYPPLAVDNYIPVKRDCVNFWEKNRDKFKDFLTKSVQGMSGVLFFISAGPMAKVIIDHLWKVNPTNRYIDVGSAIDEFIYGAPTRPYMIRNNPYYYRVCTF